MLGPIARHNFVHQERFSTVHTVRTILPAVRMEDVKWQLFSFLDIIWGFLQFTQSEPSYPLSVWKMLSDSCSHFQTLSKYFPSRKESCSHRHHHPMYCLSDPSACVQVILFSAGKRVLLTKTTPSYALSVWSWCVCAGELIFRWKESPVHKDCTILCTVCMIPMHVCKIARFQQKRESHSHRQYHPMHCLYDPDACVQVSSLWFKLYVYTLTGCGPPSLLLVKGTKLKRLPDIFQVILAWTQLCQDVAHPKAGPQQR